MAPDTHVPYRRIRYHFRTATSFYHRIFEVMSSAATDLATERAEVAFPLTGKEISLDDLIGRV
jgi:hypothetical protein